MADFEIRMIAEYLGDPLVDRGSTNLEKAENLWDDLNLFESNWFGGTEMRVRFEYATPNDEIHTTNWRSSDGCPPEIRHKKSREAVPIQCRARAAFILSRAAELIETFLNGNRKDFVEALDLFPRRMAYAVLAAAMIHTKGARRASLASFLLEMA